MEEGEGGGGGGGGEDKRMRNSLDIFLERVRCSPSIVPIVSILSKVGGPSSTHNLSTLHRDSSILIHNIHTCTRTHTTSISYLVLYTQLIV